MDSENEKLILDGNAFYEIDLSCLRKKERESETDQVCACRQKNNRISKTAGKR
ncbi:MAG TPA: hypothetical protein IAA26_15815 [Candidatus Blautia faecipullorum]|nr:hypothetical protein [Candidatus Blautia faecipullorum]